MRKLVVLLLALIVSGCVSTGSSNTASIGRFIFAGPKSAASDIVSVAWTYGFQFNSASPSYDQIKFSCEPIPGSTFTIDGSGLTLNADRVAYWDGEPLPLSKETTPWLYDDKTTQADCVAIFEKANQAPVTVTAGVTFNPMKKIITVMQLNDAHEYNSKLNKK